MNLNEPFSLKALFNVLGLGALGALGLALIVLFILSIVI